MTPVRRWRRYVIVAGAVLFTLTIASACGGDQADERAASASAAAFDQALHDHLPAAILQRGTIRVGGSDPYPPAGFYAPDGRTVVGFEPDLAAEMGRVLGVRFEFVNLSFSDLLPQLRRHKIDIAMASMTDNAEREKQADFVNYFQAGTAIIVQRGNPQGISTLKDLCGEVVAVAEGTVQVDLLRRTRRAATRTGSASGPTVTTRTPFSSCAPVVPPPSSATIRQPSTCRRTPHQRSLPAGGQYAVRAEPLRHRRGEGPERAARQPA